MKILCNILLCLMSFWLTAPRILAAPLDKAKAAFTAGDFKKAASLASKAVKKSKGKEAKAEAYALSATASVKAGKSKAGKSKFIKALKLDPNVAIPAEAGSDAKVKKAFASAQKKAGTPVSDGGESASTDRLTKSGSAKSARSPGNLTNYVPFGYNSYAQGKTLTAAALGGAQIMGLFVIVNRKMAISKADKEAAATIEDAKANNATKDQRFTDFISQNAAFVKKANSEANLGLLLLAAGYGLSIVDSLYDPLGTSRSASLDFKSGEAYADFGAASEPKIDTSWKFDLRVIPAVDPMIVVALKQNF